MPKERNFIQKMMDNYILRKISKNSEFAERMNLKALTEINKDIQESTNQLGKIIDFKTNAPSWQDLKSYVKARIIKIAVTRYLDDMMTTYEKRVIEEGDRIIANVKCEKKEQ